MAVDNQKAETVTKWLTAQKVECQQVPPEDVIRETKKGLAVFNLVSSSIPPKTLENMTKKFGGIIESNLEYQQRVNSLATRPQFLKPPEQAAQSPPLQSRHSTSPQDVQNVAPSGIKGKAIPMNYPLMMHGDTNPIPVNTCIDAMRGYGRTHTTRAYQPYKQYGFKEGDIALATGIDKQVAFRVGKQYQITPDMIADPVYQQQWADMEKHSPKALPELFTEKKQVWGLHLEPLGDYVEGFIVPFPEPQNRAVPNQEVQPQSVTIENHQSNKAHNYNFNSLGKCRLNIHCIFPKILMFTKFPRSVRNLVIKYEANTRGFKRECESLHLQTNSWGD
ncbi:hypothetical protein [Nostoc commune]|uniref:hypothetical protein n=1 Tax=Nostoc commune TaxID=1178 RepID=UPI001E64DB4A|nr:hypothetical protein [Nostoc commune]